MNMADKFKAEREEREAAKRRKEIVITYIDGEINKDYIVVRNAETMPKGARHSQWGTFFPGQGQDGYGRKITTDMMVQVKATGKKYRVYCTCFSNAGSHWLTMNKKTIHLGTVFQNEIRDTFYTDEELAG